MLDKSLPFLIYTILCIPAVLLAQPTADDIAKIKAAVPESATVAPESPRKLLVFTRTEGFVHDSIPFGAKALEIMGQKTGAFSVEVRDDMAAFVKENLQKFDAVCFVSTTQLKFENQTYRQNLIDFVKSGKGIAGIHAATDNFYTWPEAAAMMGGLFDGHPWHSGGTWAVKIDDPEHSVAAAFHGEGFTINDELYRLKKPYSRENLRVLLSLNFDDEATNEAPGMRPDDVDVAVSWVRSFGEGRVFYSSLGHNPHIYWLPAVLQHYLDGIQFALGDLPADTTPSLDVALAELAKYDYGHSLEPLMMIDDFIRFSNDSVEALQRLETRFLKMLASDLSLAGRQYICEKLRLIGSEKAVPMLTEMLAIPATAEMARYALEGLPGSAVDAALLDALGQSQGRTKIGLITTLGQRRTGSAIAALSGLLSEEPDIARAAVAALAAIATPEAAETLIEARQSGPVSMRGAVDEALLRCAENLQAAGARKQALEIYHRLSNKEAPILVQSAALRGLVLASAPDIDKRIMRAVQSESPEMQAAAIGLLREIRDTKTAQRIAREMPNLPSPAQVQMLSAFAERGQSDVLEYVVTATKKSSHKNVRLAALQALARLGDASTVERLAKVAAQADEQQAAAARASLNRLTGAKVEDAIHTGIASAAAPEKAELIRAAGERRMQSATPIVLSAANDSSAAVRLAAAHALRTLGEPDIVPDLVALLIGAPSNRERRELELTIAGIARKISPPNRRAQAVLAALPQAGNTSDKISLLSVLGKIGDASALPALQSHLKHENPQVAAAAIRALSEWPDNTPEATLFSVATSASTDVHRILGLRGYVRMLSLDSTRTAAENVEKYRGAMALAQNASERRMVLSGLAAQHTPEAFDFTAAYLSDADLQQEAAVAAIKIAEALFGRNVPSMSTVLHHVTETGLAESLRNQADSLAVAAAKIEDHLTDWLVARPFSEGEVDLLQLAFPPEKSDASTEWQLFRAETDPDNYWRLELDKVIGGDRVVAYLRTNVWSEKDQPARLELGSDDGVKVWLNGEVVHLHDASRAVSPGQDIIDVFLKAGWNTLMLKVANKGGGWGACARFRQPDGSRLPGLKVRAEE